MQWTPFSSATLTGPWTWPAGRTMSSSPLTRRSPRKWAGWPVAGSCRLRCLGGSHLGSPGSEHTPQPDIGHRGWLRKLGGADMMKITSLMRVRSEEHTSELQSLMRISYAVFCLKKKNKYSTNYNDK